VDDGPQSVDPAESGSAAESPDVPTAEPPTDTDAPAAEAPTDTTPVPPNEVTPSTDAELDAPTSRPPDASLDAAFDWRPTEPSVGRTVTFDASATAVPEGSEPSYAWRFGDGLTFEGPVVERRFETDDPQTVTLNVSLGPTTFSTATATVRPTRGDPPTARIDPSASELPLGEPVRFDGRRSTDEDGEIVTYAWTFSDGDQREGPSVARTFEAGSTVTVALTVTDDRGLSHTATTTYALGSQAAAVGPSPPPVPVEVVGLVVGATAAVFTFAGAVGSGVPPPPPSPPGPGFDAPRGERRNERSEGRDDRRRYRPPLRITRVRPSRSDPDSEFVELHNPTETPLSLGGAVVEGAGVVYEFEDGARIGADERLALYTGRGTDAPDGSVRYGGSAVSVLDAGVGCVTVRRGSVALGRRTYVGSVGRVRDALGR
jgi:chitodextrinase